MKPKDLLPLFLVLVCLGLFPATTGGCGFLLTHAPPEGHEQMDYFTCTESDTGPILDLVWAGLSVAGAIICAASSDEDYYDPYYDTATCTAAGLTWGVVVGSSGIVGLNKTKKCRAAKRQLAERQLQGRAAEEARPADILVQAVVLTPRADTLTVGKQVQLMATAYNSSGTVITNKIFAWSSSNDAIASVSNAGQVTAHAVGAVVIAARTDNVVGIANILVVTAR